MTLAENGFRRLEGSSLINTCGVCFVIALHCKKNVNEHAEGKIVLLTEETLLSRETFVLGVTPAQKLHLNIFSLSDGKGALVELTKSLCQSAVSGHVRTADINQDIIDEHLRAELDIPDPELALICGDVCSTYGFLPWQIRVTEFLYVTHILTG
jgi:dehydrodolichyl diphosphate syntase complex subunit NUS1